MVAIHFVVLVDDIMFVKGLLCVINDFKTKTMSLYTSSTKTMN